MTAYSCVRAILRTGLTTSRSYRMLRSLAYTKDILTTEVDSKRGLQRSCRETIKPANT